MPCVAEYTIFCNVYVYRIQSQRVRLQHALLSVQAVCLLNVPPSLSALHITQPPAAEICNGLSLIGAPPSPQTPE